MDPSKLFTEKSVQNALKEILIRSVGRCDSPLSKNGQQGDDQEEVEFSKILVSPPVSRVDGALWGVRGDGGSRLLRVVGNHGFQMVVMLMMTVKIASLGL